MQPMRILTLSKVLRAASCHSKTDDDRYRAGKGLNRLEKSVMQRDEQNGSETFVNLRPMVSEIQKAGVPAHNAARAPR